MENKNESPSKITKEILSYSTEKNRLKISLIFAIVGEIIGFTAFFYAGYVANSIYTKSLDINKLFIYGLITILIIAIKYILTWKSSSISHQVSYKVLSNIRKELSKKLEKIPLGYITNKPIGYYSSIINERVSVLEDWIAHVLPEMPSKTLNPILSLIILMIIDYRIGLSVFATAPLIALGMWIMLYDSKNKVKIWLEKGANLNSTIIEYVNGIKVIKAFGQENKSYKKFTRVVNEYYDTTLAWYKQSWLGMSIVFACMTSPLIAILPISSYLYKTGQISMYELVLSLILPLSIIVNILNAVQGLELYAVITPSWNMIKEVFNTKELIRPKKEVILDKNKSYEFRNVSFSYEKDMKVLDNISFNINKNEVVAIVGESGSGKTTIAKLMVDYFDADSGNILYGGVDIKDIPLEQLMNDISYVSQDSFLFNTSILENIRLAKPNATDDEINEVIKMANCLDLIQKLPNGINTNVGDYGSLLSGGEKQKIVIARAMLKNSECIILDEATAYSDPENEYVIQEAITKLVKDKTLIVIAHRLHTIINADKIIVIDKGKINSIGKHNELIKTSHKYRQLWENYTGMSVTI